MPIPNISTLYQRISNGSEGGHEFARFVRMLFNADYEAQGVRFISESDASGDYKKVDAFIPGDIDFPNNIIGFQFKFFPSKLSSTQKQEIVRSIETAIKENEFIQELILVTPEDFMKEQQEWFDSLKEKYEEVYWGDSNGLYRKCKFELIHWGHSKIVELSLKHDHIGSHYFPELFPNGKGKMKLSKIGIDEQLSLWGKSEHSKNGYYQISLRDNDDKRTTDPVFDFQFKNSTDEIHLLNKIEVHIEEVWTTLRGIPIDQFLRSVGTIIHKMDFDKPVNTINLPDPLIFEKNSPKRFKLQLESFSNRCPGNSAKIKFWFYFDEITIPTDSYTMIM